MRWLVKYVTPYGEIRTEEWCTVAVLVEDAKRELEESWIIGGILELTPLERIG